MKEVPKELRVKGKEPIKAFPYDTVVEAKDKKMNILNGMFTKA